MQYTTGNIGAVLGNLPLFEGIDPLLIDELTRSAQILRLPKGALVYSVGEDARAMYHVLTGQLKIAVTSSDGVEKVIDIVGEGQVIGIAELFGNVPYASLAQAVGPVVLLQIGREAIARAIELDARVPQRLLKAIGQRQAAIERDIAASTFHSGCRRVVDYLLRQAGPGLAHSDTEVELGIPKHVLASRLGFTPETLSRTFRFLTDAGMIRVRGRQVTLFRKLASVAANDDFDMTWAPTGTDRSRARTTAWYPAAGHPASVAVPG